MSPGSVQTGELHVDLGSNVGVKPEAYAWTSLAATGLYPGGSMPAAVVPIGNNSGPRLGLEFTVSARVTNTSASVADAGIVVTIRSGATADGASCAGGTELVAAQRLTGVLTALPMAPQPLGPAAAGQVCVQVKMAQDAPNSVQGTTSRIILRFEARSVSP